MCPDCGYPTVPGGNFCQRCGRPFGAAASAGAAPFATTGAPLPSSGYAAPAYPAPPAYAAPPAGPPTLPGSIVVARDRTVTGLLLLVIGIALSWIPDVSIIGDILAFIGIILLIVGRDGYGPEHRRYVVVGGTLFILTLIAALALAVWFVIAFLGSLSLNSSGTVTISASAIESDLFVFFVGIAIVGILGALSRVIMVYALADRTTRILLWAGFAASVVFSLVILAVIYPQIVTAVNQATSGSTFNNGPLNSLQTQSTVLGLVNVLPTLLTAWAYWRAREEALARTNSPAY